MIDHDAFVKCWPVYSERLNDILAVEFSSSIRTEWSKDIQDVLVLLKLLPPKGKSSTLPFKSFNKAIAKLIVFRKVFQKFNFAV